MDVSPFVDSLPILGVPSIMDETSLSQRVSIFDSITRAILAETLPIDQVTLQMESGQRYSGSPAEISAWLLDLIDQSVSSAAKYDIDGSGIVDGNDLLLFDDLSNLQAWNGVTFSILDVNGDKNIDYDDRCEIVNHFGTYVD
ncbi:MAG: hypothetical protein HUU18_04835 [Phycisphaerales bacterium]|nr:hypothetical protein [Phycisphaerales bacterium]